MAVSITFPAALPHWRPDNHDAHLEKYQNPAILHLKNCRNVQECVQVHGFMVKAGLCRDLHSVGKLIAACAEAATPESVDYARKVFEESEGVSLFMYNSIIKGYSHVGNGEALLLYCRMLLEGISPDHFTFPFLLNACAKVQAAKEGLQVQASLTKLGLDSDAFIQNSLMHFYAVCGDMKLARKVFDGISERNVVSWTILVCGFVRNGSPQQALAVFEEMRESGVRANEVTMANVVSACAEMKNLEVGMKVHDYIRESGIEINEVLSNAIVDMYAKCGDMVGARTMFNEMPEKNIVLWNTMLSNYSQRGEAYEAIAVFQKMVKSGTRLDRVTVVAMFTVCAQMGNVELGKTIHGYVFRNGLDGWDFVVNAAIDMYMKCGAVREAIRMFNKMHERSVASWNTIIAGCVRNGDLDSGWKLFDQMPQRDLVSWNTMIAAFTQASFFKEALMLFREMQLAGTMADRITMVSVASACGYLGALDLAMWVHAFIDKNNIDLDVCLGTALIDMYARCGNAKNAIDVFNRMTRIDVLSWTAAIGALAMQGLSEEALDLFSEMKKQGIQPDSVTFVEVLTACSHGGLVHEGLRYFHSMVHDYGISPQLVHYGCMVDLLGRAGLLEEALELIRGMPMEPNDVIWGALLAACRVHNNVELAEHAARRILDSAPERVGVYILLSNVYASAGMWAKVAEVRLQLKEKGVKKMPGSSMIQMSGKIHEFTAGDMTHLQAREIEAMLGEMGRKLRRAGYTPDLSNVLLDLDGEDKEQILGHHSEKLAMAFGLISTRHGAAIRIVKNLRMCGDCHTFAKFVSELYDREIVLSGFAFASQRIAG
ncbi:Pentatricopeptide repeat-containing protein [Nymphaea thermarum]|nr:Pentatricopeptide repeat-containing protein [Nymphaea thermarum]